MTLIALSGCGPPQLEATLDKGLVPLDDDTEVQCPIAGVYVNQSDGVTASLTTLNGLCRLQLSCGATAWLFDQGGNQWMVLMETGLGDTAGGCGYPAQYTNHVDTNGTTHSGQYYSATFSLYAGIGYQGGFMPSQLNQPWVKQ